MPDSVSVGARGEYHGACHCGAVAVTVRLPERPVVDICNCSICTKSAFQHLLVAADAMDITQGEDTLTTYTFNTHQAQHLFCRVCGVKVFYVPRSHPHGFSVNARCLRDFKPDPNAVRSFDGRHFEDNIATLQAQTPDV